MVASELLRRVCQLPSRVGVLGVEISLLADVCHHFDNRDFVPLSFQFNQSFLEEGLARQTVQFFADVAVSFVDVPFWFGRLFLLYISGKLFLVKSSRIAYCLALPWL